MVSQPVTTGFDDLRQMADSATSDRDRDTALRHGNVHRRESLMNDCGDVLQRAGNKLLMDFKKLHCEIICECWQMLERPAFYDVSRCTATHITRKSRLMCANENAFPLLCVKTLAEGRSLALKFFGNICVCLASGRLAHPTACIT